MLTRQHRQRATDPDFQTTYRTHRPMVERSIAWLVRGNRRVPHRGVAKNNDWLHHRVAALKLRRLLALGLTQREGSWQLAWTPRQHPTMNPSPTAITTLANGRVDLLATVVDLLIAFGSTLALEWVHAFAGDGRRNGSDMAPGRWLRPADPPSPRRAAGAPRSGQRGAAGRHARPARADGGELEDTPAPAGPVSPVARFAVRWLPMIVVGTAGIAVVTVAELATVAVRRDRRSLAGLLSGSMTRTHDSLAQGADGPFDAAPDAVSP